MPGKELDKDLMARVKKLLNSKAIKPDVIVNELKSNGVVLDKPISNDFVPYPDYADADFNNKIAVKKEFAKNKYDDVNKATCENVQFTLTPNQRFLKQFMNPRTPYNSILLFHGVGVGKCHGKDTPIIMYDGSVKMVQDVQVNDLLMGDDSQPRTVLALGQGHDEMYEITPLVGGDSFIVNSEHILCLKLQPEGHTVEATVKDYLAMSSEMRDRLFLYRTAVDFQHPTTATSVADAYELGKAINIPAHLKTNKYDVRLHTLAGVVDAIAQYEKEYYLLKGLEPAIAKDVAFLARSLGIGADLNSHETDRLLLYGSQLHNLPVKTAPLVKTNDDGLLTPFNINALGHGDYYGFTLDGNHHYLLGDFTVTHNTCTSISIAEQFRNVYNKPALVLLPTKLKDNFMQQVFDIYKFKDGQPQCTGNTYVEHIPDAAIMDPVALRRKIDKRIRENYELKGFGELQSFIHGMDEALKKIEPREEQRKAKMDARLKQIFSNRVIIIDEVHNVRAEGEDTSKRVPPLILHLLRIAENVKLVLLTATPMFNNSKEILYLLNYIMANEKRPELKPSDVFNKDGSLSDNGRARLIEITRGYVSYMRGENPITFPARLYPTHLTKDHKAPIEDAKGRVIEKSQQLQFLPIVPSAMSDLQHSVYSVAMNSIVIKEIEKDEKNVDSPDFDIGDEEEGDSNGRIMQQAVQISNIIYPDPPLDKKSGKTSKKIKPPTKQALRTFYGREGFYKCFNNTTKSNFTVEYNTQFANYHFLDEANLSDCSAKLNTIVESILNSTGIVYVYSYYLYSALIPLAIALEHRGYNKYSSKGNNMNILNGTYKRGNHKGTYVILASTQEKAICPDIKEEVEVIKSAANKRGEIVKVILGTSVSSEGIDFKRIREVHLVEPWYHLNKVEQIVGRAIRHCSHVDLPEEERNVTIYHHANVLPNSTVESIDQRIYRIAEFKQKNIDDVENILRRNAVDCTLNKAALFYPKKFEKKLKTSQKMTIDYKPGDDPDGKYARGAKCLASPPSAIDDTTFDMTSLEDMVPFYSQHIAAIIEEDPLTLEQILKKLDSKLDSEIVMVVLNKMIQDLVLFNNKKGHRGTLDYVHNTYVFQPEDAFDSRLSIKSRRSFVPVTSTKLRIKGTTRARAAQVNTSWELLEERVRQLFQEMDVPYSTSHKLFNVAIDAVVDRLNEDELVHFAQAIASTPDNYPNHLLTSMKDAYIILELEGERFVRNIHRYTKAGTGSTDKDNCDSGECREYSKIVNGGLQAPSPLEESQLSAMKPAVPASIKDWVGYILINSDKGKVDFKLINPEAKSDGFVAKQTASFTVEKATQSIEKLDSKILKDKSLKKESLCVIYELLLRKTPKIFGRPYHTHVLMQKAKDDKDKAKDDAKKAAKAAKAKPKKPTVSNSKAIKEKK